MSKYVIDLGKDVRIVQSISVTPYGNAYTHTEGIANLEELNSDYINEHYGSLQDEAYQRGLEDGRAQDSHGCEGCEWDGTPFDVCSKCRNSYKNLYERKDTDDEIKVGDEVRWYNEKIVITCLHYNNGFNWCDGINKDGRVFNVLKEKVTKTGHHFDIDKILEEMKE